MQWPSSRGWGRHCQANRLLQIHARLGEVLYISTLPAGSAADAATEKALVQAVRRYCRSIELCDGYLRGYYGLKIVSTAVAVMTLGFY